MSSMSTEFLRPLSSTATASWRASPSTNPRSSSSSHCSSRPASSRSKASMLGRNRIGGDRWAALRLDHLSAQGAQKSQHDRYPDHFAISRYESFVEGALLARVADLSAR